MGDKVRLGSAGDVPPDAITAFTVGQRRIAVARVGPALYAFDDLCTHAYCSLAEGDLEGATVVCACHLGTYDLTTGEVLDGPPPDPIAVYPVTEVDGELLVEL